MRDDLPHFHERERNEILPKPPLDRRPATLSSNAMPAPPLMVRGFKKRAREIQERLATAAPSRETFEPLAVQ